MWQEEISKICSRVNPFLLAGHFKLGWRPLKIDEGGSDASHNKRFASGKTSGV